MFFITYGVLISSACLASVLYILIFMLIIIMLTLHTMNSRAFHGSHIEDNVSFRFGGRVRVMIICVKMVQISKF